MKQIKVIRRKSILQQISVRGDEDRAAVATITAEKNCDAFIRHRDAGLPVTFVKNGVIITQQQGKTPRFGGRVKMNKAGVKK